MRLRLLRGRPGGELKEAAVLDGPFAAEHAYAFVESPGGKVWLVASIAESGTHLASRGAEALAPDLRLAVWSLAGAKPECVGSFARARDARQISGAFADETTLHVVFGDVSGFWAETWKVEAPKAAVRPGPAAPKPAAAKRK